MPLYSVFFIAFGLAMDAFAVSVSNGIAIDNFKTNQKIKMSLYFGVFQFLMPIIGFLLGRTIAGFITFIDHWIAFVLLSIIGGNMIVEALKGDDDCEMAASKGLSNKALLMQAVATSIDALVIGITFAVLEVNIYFASVVIGVVCFCISLVGAMAGEKLGCLFKDKAEIFGGLILIGIGVKTLIEHLFF